MSTLREYINDHLLYLDGGTGTLLQKAGLAAGELSESWNLSHPDEIISVHKAYYDAGTNLIATNTFGVNTIKYTLDEAETLIRAAVDNAKKAKEICLGTQEKFIALDVSSLGKLLKPLGTLDFEEAVRHFADVIRIGAPLGVDAVLIETMSDIYETKAALLAAKENCALPVFVSNAFGEDGKLMTGADAKTCVAVLEGLGADMIGVNCSFGPDTLSAVVELYLENASVPVLFKPNAGLPGVVDGKTVYDITPKQFADTVASLAKKGVRAIGGCCGTTPEYIKELVAATKNIAITPIEKKHITRVSSYTHTVSFGERPIIVGERINPTGKKRFKQALAEHDIGYILSVGAAEENQGADVLDVNVGLPGIDEAAMITEVIGELQAVTALPLQIDTADRKAMESALRRYNGKALINSVNGKKESMDAVFPLMKKYGGVCVALTLDENGIPLTAKGRVEIANRILAEGEKYGFTKDDFLFDTLTMSVSADESAAIVTLDALEKLHDMGCKTMLGVSNISFGLPNRDIVSGAFFYTALMRGLDAAILNPESFEMNKALRTYMLLTGKDAHAEKYIAFASAFEQSTAVSAASTAVSFADTLKEAVRRGMKDKAAAMTAEAIKTADPLAVIKNEIIPALNDIGEAFEKKTAYLPQLLMSAEAAGAAFDVIKASFPKKDGDTGIRFVIATVKGDIHDIGKNIVKLLLENYGFDVTDLGKDVPPEVIAKTVCELHAPFTGLSALMTTTVPAMEETIKLLRKEAPFTKIVVGGAVLNEDYAMQIGADKYAADAMETVRYALAYTDKE